MAKYEIDFVFRYWKPYDQFGLMKATECPRSFRALHSSMASSNFNLPPDQAVTNFRA